MPQFTDGFVDIVGGNPQLTLTDNAPAGAKSLKIDVNNNIAQIRELAGAANSLITLDLVNNRVGIRKSPASKELEISGAVDISSIAPSLTLTDTDVGAKSLKIDVNNNIAQIREKGGVDNSLLSFDLNMNFIWALGRPPSFPSSDANFVVAKDPVSSSALIDPGNLFLVFAVIRNGRPGTYSAAQCSVDVFGGSVDKVVGLTCTCALASVAVNANFSSAIDAFCTNVSGGTIANSHVINIGPALGTSPITNSIGIRIAKQRGTIRNYGLYYGTVTPGDERAGTYAIYAADDNCFFGGNVGIGIEAPNAFLHIKAGTANVAPFKLTAGVKLTIPQAGAFEYDGTNLYFTKGDKIRRVIQMV